MSIEPTRFKAMRFNPTAAKKSMVETYKPLESIANDWLRSVTVQDKVLRYVCFMYDPASPMKDEYADISRRKLFAASEAGFDVNDEKDAILEAIMNCSSDGFVELVANFLRLTNSRLWTMITTNEQCFYEYNMRAMKAIDVDRTNTDKDMISAVQTKTKLLEDAHNIDARLTEYYRRLTGEDEDVVEKIQKRKALTPEMMSKGMMNV